VIRITRRIIPRAPGESKKASCNKVTTAASEGRALHSMLAHGEKNGLVTDLETKPLKAP
jgi:hypothetical protein